MRIITFDIGNSNPHFGIYENSKLQNILPIDSYQFQKGDQRIICSVKKNITIEHEFNLSDYKNNSHFFDMPFHYSESIGIDRLTVAYKVFKNIKSSTLVIDAGTFMTIDLVDNVEGFKGGWIFPGIKTFLSSYQRGELLPILNFGVNSFRVPQSTEEAINNACHVFLKSVLTETFQSTSPSKIVITGGSGKIIFELLKEINLKVELQLDPTLIHDSMYLIHQNHLK